MMVGNGLPRRIATPFGIILTDCSNLIDAIDGHHYSRRTFEHTGQRRSASTTPENRKCYQNGEQSRAHAEAASIYYRVSQCSNHRLCSVI